MWVKQCHKPSVIAIFKDGINLPFLVMGGKNGIVLSCFIMFYPHDFFINMAMKFQGSTPLHPAKVLRSVSVPGNALAAEPKQNPSVPKRNIMKYRCVQHLW